MTDKTSIKLVEEPHRPNISFNGRLLYSSSSTPEKRAEGLPQTSQTLYIITSPLLFYGVDNLLECIDDSSKIIAVEYDTDLYEFTKQLIDPELLEQIEYFLLNIEASEFLRVSGLSRFRRISSVRLNMGYMLNRKAYDDFVQKADDYLKSFWKNRMTTIHMGRLWCRNIFLNLPFLTNSALSGLKENTAGKSVFVAGAGESLEHSISFIQNNRERIFLIAVDTAVPALLNSSIRPDLVVIVESQHANLYDFYNPDALTLPAAFDLTSSPELIRKFKGPKYFFVSEFDYSVIFKAIDEYNLLPVMIPPLGSVGITAVYISLLLSGGNIFYTGLDFSFIPEKYHAKGSYSDIITTINSSRIQNSGFYSAAYSDRRHKISDKSGRTVYTDIIMQSYSESLRELVTKSNRLFDIGKTGLSSAENFINETEADKLLKQTDTTSNNTTSDNSFLPDINVRTSDFLKSELNKIEDTIRDVIEFQNNRHENSLISQILKDKLLKLDYTWLFFPDTGELPSSSASFLKRFLFSAAWFKNHLQNALHLVSPKE